MKIGKIYMINPDKGAERSYPIYNDDRLYHLSRYMEKNETFVLIEYAKENKDSYFPDICHLRILTEDGIVYRMMINSMFLEQDIIEMHHT